MAGLAETCSHVRAVLHWLETAVRIRDDTTSTSKENLWMIPKPVQHVPFLQLSEMNFSAPKHPCNCMHAQIAADLSISKTGQGLSAHTALKIAPPSETDIQGFLSCVAREQKHRPVVLVVVPPYGDEFASSSDHLPPLLNGLFKAEYLELDFNKPLEWADNHACINQLTTPAMVEHLLALTNSQSKSKSWFQYRAGRITASHFCQVLHTNLHQPSVSLLKTICYTEIHKFSAPSTFWGIEHEKDGFEAYHNQVALSHQELTISSCGLFVSVDHHFLGASPDALVQCACCG